jgi:hypothetical protein
VDDIIVRMYEYDVLCQASCVLLLADHQNDSRRGLWCAPCLHEYTTLLMQYELLPVRPLISNWRGD